MRTILLLPMLLSGPGSGSDEPKQKAAIEAICAKGGNFDFDLKTPGHPVIEVTCSKCGISDQDLVHLKVFEQLKWLYLQDVKITDKVEFPKKSGHRVKGYPGCSYSAGET